MMKNYQCRLFWVICKPHPPENLFSDEEDETGPSVDELDPFSWKGNPLNCTGPWWWSTPLTPLFEEEFFEDGSTLSDDGSDTSSQTRSDISEEKVTVNWQKALIQASTRGIYLNRQ